MDWLTPQDYKLPETWDNHTLSTHQTCPRKFELQHLQGFVQQSQARSLGFGIAFHAGMAAWYSGGALSFEEVRNLLTMGVLAGKSKRDPNIIAENELREEYMVQTALAELPPVTDLQVGDHRTDTLLENILRSYTRIYKYEPFKVVYVEKNFTLLLKDGSIYSGIIDLVIEWNGRVMPVEHKTTSSLWNFGDNFNPHQAISGYTRGLLELIPNASHDSVVNAVLVSRRRDGSVKDEDFQRYPSISRTNAQLEEFEENAVRTIEDIRSNFQRKFFPMNTNACHQYGGCPFRPICRVSPGREREIIANAFYERKFWNPLTRDANEPSD